MNQRLVEINEKEAEAKEKVLIAKRELKQAQVRCIIAYGEEYLSGTIDFNQLTCACHSFLNYNIKD